MLGAPSGVFTMLATLLAVVATLLL